MNEPRPETAVAVDILRRCGIAAFPTAAGLVAAFTSNAWHRYTADQALSLALVGRPS